MNKPDDQRVHDLIEANDPTALDMIYDLFGKRLYHYALGMLGSKEEAEDIMQEVFVKLSENLRRLLKVEKIDNYLFAMTRNMVCNTLKRKSYQTVSIDNYLNVLTCENPSPDKEEYDTNLIRALLALPLEQREIVNMKCIESLTFDKIAQALNISCHTAASRYRYAMEKLRRKLTRG